MIKRAGFFAGLALLPAAIVLFPAGTPSSHIRFSYQPIPFQLESDESQARNAP